MKAILRDYHADGVDMASIHLTDLIEVQFLQQLQDAFSEYTKIAVYTCDAQGNKITTISRETFHCSHFFHASAEGEKQCQACQRDQMKQTAAKRETMKFRCHAGLTEFIAPIMLGGEVIGGFVGTQIHDGFATKQLRIANAKKYGFDEVLYLKAFDELPEVKEEEIDAAAQFLCVMADLISQLAYANYLALQDIERLESNSSSQSAFIMNMHDNIKSQMTQIMMQSGEALKSHNPDRMSQTFEEFMLTFPEWIAGYDEVAEYASMTDTKIELEEEIYSLREVLERVVVFADSRMGEEHVTVHTLVEDSVPDTYLGDSGKLRKMLNKLVSETSKSSVDGELNICVATQKCSYATNLCIEASMQITDASKGSVLIATNDAKDNSHSGIAKVGVLVRQMAGTLAVTSDDENQIVFRIVIPQLAVAGNESK